MALLISSFAYPQITQIYTDFSDLNLRKFVKSVDEILIHLDRDHFATQTFFGSVKNSAFAETTA